MVIHGRVFSRDSINVTLNTEITSRGATFLVGHNRQQETKRHQINT